MSNKRLLIVIVLFMVIIGVGTIFSIQSFHKDSSVNLDSNYYLSQSFLKRTKAARQLIQKDLSERVTNEKWDEFNNITNPKNITGVKNINNRRLRDLFDIHRTILRKRQENLSVDTRCSILQSNLWVVLQLEAKKQGLAADVLGAGTRKFYGNYLNRYFEPFKESCSASQYTKILDWYYFYNQAHQHLNQNQKKLLLSNLEKAYDRWISKQKQLLERKRKKWDKSEEKMARITISGYQKKLKKIKSKLEGLN